MLLTCLAPYAAALLGAVAPPSATTVIEVSLLGPEGPLALSPPRAFGADRARTWVSWNYLDRPYHAQWSLSGGEVELIPGTHRALLTVDRYRPVGILGSAVGRGFVERAITPEMMAGQERLAVELVLPSKSSPGRLQVDMTFGFDRSYADPETLVLCGPLTGCWVDSVTVPRSSSSVEFELAPGDYIASMWPINRNFAACYETRPAAAAGVELRSPFTVTSAQTSTLEHAFDVVSGCSFRVDVSGREEAVAFGLAGVMGSLPGTLIELFDKPNAAAAPGWTVKAILSRKDTPSPWARRALTLAWSKRSKQIGAIVAPIGTTLWTLDRIPPGEYVIELSGPWIKPASFNIVVEDKPDWLWDSSPAHLFKVDPKD